MALSFEMMIQQRSTHLRTSSFSMPSHRKHLHQSRQSFKLVLIKLQISQKLKRPWWSQFCSPKQHVYTFLSATNAAFQHCPTASWSHWTDPAIQLFDQSYSRWISSQTKAVHAWFLPILQPLRWDIRETWSKCFHRHTRISPPERIGSSGHELQTRGDHWSQRRNRRMGHQDQLTCFTYFMLLSSFNIAHAHITITQLSHSLSYHNTRDIAVH